MTACSRSWPVEEITFARGQKAHGWRDQAGGVGVGQKGSAMRLENDVLVVGGRRKRGEVIEVVRTAKRKQQSSQRKGPGKAA